MAQVHCNLLRTVTKCDARCANYLISPIVSRLSLADIVTNGICLVSITIECRSITAAKPLIVYSRWVSPHCLPLHCFDAGHDVSKTTEPIASLNLENAHMMRSSASVSKFCVAVLVANPSIQGLAASCWQLVAHHSGHRAGISSSSTHKHDHDP